VAGEWLGTNVPLKRQHNRPAGMGLHICAVVQRGASSASEYVEIVNDGAEPVPVTGLELTDCCGEEHKHVYTFPKGELDPGETAYVYSGEGTSQRTHTNDLMLYAGLPGRVWKDESHVAHLRHPDGRIIDTMRVGRPPRHPEGH
jgi:lamin tail-like protein